MNKLHVDVTVFTKLSGTKCERKRKEVFPSFIGNHLNPGFSKHPGQVSRKSYFPKVITNKPS